MVLPGCVVECRTQLLSPCAVLGEGQVAPVHAECRVASLSTVKLDGFGTFCFPDASGLLGASGCLWVPPGCLLGASWVPPGCLLGASWVSPGASWVPPGPSWVPPGASWDLLGPPGCLLGPPGPSWGRQGASWLGGACRGPGEYANSRGRSCLAWRLLGDPSDPL